MRASSLPGLRGQITNGHQLRIVLAKAISEVEVYAKRGHVLPASVAALQALLDAGDTALTAVKAIPASIALTSPGGDVALDLSDVETKQLVVTKTPLSGSTTNVAATSTYTTSDATKVTVSATGLVTPVGVGTSIVTAKYQDRTSNSLTFTVTA